MALFKCIIAITLAFLCNITLAEDSAIDCVSMKMLANEVHYSQFWTKLSNSKVVKYNRENLYSRDLFTFVQKDLESSITSCAKTHGIDSFLLILHDSQSIKLFSNDDHESKGITGINLSEKGKSIYSKRSIPLTEYLNLGGIIISTYRTQDKNKYLPISGRYKNFVSTPVKLLGNDKLGATYLIKDSSGSFYMWSVDEYAAPKSDSYPREMKMWFGTLDDKEVSKRLVNVESFLKSQGVDIYQYLGFDRSDR